MIDFLRQLERQLPGEILLVWDRLVAHRAQGVQAFLGARPYLHPFFLPPYAPELNPVEGVWAYLKTNPLANLTAADLETLTATARSHARSVQRKEHLLRSFLKHGLLSLRLC